MDAVRHLAGLAQRLQLPRSAPARGTAGRRGGISKGNACGIWAVPQSCPLFPQAEPLTSDDSAFETFSFFIRVHSPRVGLGQTQRGRPFGQNARSSDIPHGENFLTRNCQAFLEMPQQSLTQHTLHTHACTHMYTHTHSHTHMRTHGTANVRSFIPHILPQHLPRVEHCPRCWRHHREQERPGLSL